MAKKESHDGKKEAKKSTKKSSKGPFFSSIFFHFLPLFRHDVYINSSLNAAA